MISLFLDIRLATVYFFQATRTASGSPTLFYRVFGLPVLSLPTGLFSDTAKAVLQSTTPPQLSSVPPPHTPKDLNVRLPLSCSPSSGWVFLSCQGGTPFLGSAPYFFAVGMSILSGRAVVRPLPRFCLTRFPFPSGELAVGCCLSSFTAPGPESGENLFWWDEAVFLS